jgi:DNA (cytosine-5)-methyltransferase 1
VPGVLNTKDNAFGCFLGALAGEVDQIVPSGDKWPNAGCVFGPQRTVAWRVLDAQYFGVAQRRRRVFVVASARNDFNPAEVLFEFEGVRRDIAPSRKEGQRIAPCVTNGPPFSRTGNERVEAEAMVVWPPEVAPTLTSDFGDKLGQNNQHIDSQKGGMFVPSVLQPTYAIQGSMIGRNDNAGPQGDGINEEVCFTQNTIDRHAVAQPIAFGVGEQSDLGHCLRAGASKADKHESTTYAVQSMAVRRLTPTECERLQGFPDGYTNIPWRKAAESPDGPRYKALGNSWAVPVVRWIGKRIQERITT